MHWVEKLPHLELIKHEGDMIVARVKSRADGRELLLGYSLGPLNTGLDKVKSECTERTLSIGLNFA